MVKMIQGGAANLVRSGYFLSILANFFLASASATPYLGVNALEQTTCSVVLLTIDTLMGGVDAEFTRRAPSLAYPATAGRFGGLEREPAALAFGHGRSVGLAPHEYRSAAVGRTSDRPQLRLFVRLTTDGAWPDGKRSFQGRPCSALPTGCRHEMALRTGWPCHIGHARPQSPRPGARS